MSERIQGHCHCGAVHVSVPADAFGVIACHCEDCQKLHGNFFAMLAVPTAAVEWGGSAERVRYASSATVQRSFCPVCGSRIAKEPRDGERVLLSVGLFDRHLPRTIARQVSTDSKPDWYALPSGAD